ncbi:MAG TPA: FHA domain-containing protein, partial [Aliiroseovarius sp.]|nr:FHA domain-containing protein [Aliiroseovarius sp.]
MTNEVTLVEKPLFPRLTVKAGGRVIKEIELKGDLTIGRAEDNDLELLDPKVSRHHARIKLEGGTFILSDLGSANGTRVNGVRITESHILRHGERIGIGDAELLYQEPGKSVQDTVTSLKPPPAVGATQLGPAAAARDKGRGTGIVIGLLLVGVVLLLAAVAVGVYLFAPGVYEQIGLISPASPTPAPEAASPTPISEAVG